jgi:hypothetical protein
MEVRSLEVRLKGDIEIQASPFVIASQLPRVEQIRSTVHFLPCYSVLSQA